MTSGQFEMAGMMAITPHPHICLNCDQPIDISCFSDDNQHRQWRILHDDCLEEWRQLAVRGTICEEDIVYKATADRRRGV